jgi:hypothetical protein
MDLLSNILSRDVVLSEEAIGFIDICLKYQKVGFVNGVLTALAYRIGKRHLSESFDIIPVSDIKDSMKLSWENVYSGLKTLNEREAKILLQKAPLSIGQFTAIWDAFIGNNKKTFVEIFNNTTNTTEYNLKLGWLFFNAHAFLYSLNRGREGVDVLSLFEEEASQIIYIPVKNNEEANDLLSIYIKASERLFLTTDYCVQLKIRNKDELLPFIETNLYPNLIENLSTSLQDDTKLIINMAYRLLTLAGISALSIKEKEILDSIFDENVYVKQLLDSVNEMDDSNTEEVHEVHERDDAVNKSDSADDMPKTDGTNTEVSEIEIDYSSVLMKWRELYNKRYKSKGIKTFIPIRKLTEEEVNNLAVGLINSGFIDKTTDSKRLAHILSGKEYDGRDPVIWIKTLKNNHKPSKASILNFLDLLGVKKETIIPERLNCCFLCSDPNSFVEFAGNNMSKSKHSEYKGDLESIIRSVFKEGDVIIRLMENNKSNK